MSTHKRITSIHDRAARELFIACIVVRCVAASLAADVRHVVGWSRYCSGL